MNDSWYPVLVLAEEIARGDGSLQASLHSMLLDGSLQEVVSILSKALYGEPMVGIIKNVYNICVKTAYYMIIILLYTQCGK